MPTTVVAGWSRNAFTYSPADSPAPRIPTPNSAKLLALRVKDEWSFAVAGESLDDPSNRLRRLSTSLVSTISGGLSPPLSRRLGDRLHIVDNLPAAWVDSSGCEAESNQARWAGSHLRPELVRGSGADRGGARAA